MSNIYYIFFIMLVILSACSTDKTLNSQLEAISTTPINASNQAIPPQVQKEENLANQPLTKTTETTDLNKTDNTQTNLAQNTTINETKEIKKTSFFSIFKKKQNDDIEIAQESSPALAINPNAPNPTAGGANQKQESQNDLSVENSKSLKQMPADHALDSQQKGSIARLLNGTDKLNTHDGAKKQTSTIDAQPKKNVRDYNDELPGVRPNGGIVIKHRSSAYDDTDIDANEFDDTHSFNLAAIGGFGRNLPHGLRLARADVQVTCLKPQLMSMLQTIQRHFNTPVIITSGYRSPLYNKKVNGSNHSMHMSCAAADIILPGINKNSVAKFVRNLPKRGGVGTYCHQAIHVDVGPKRDWNWSCTAKK